MTWVASRAHGCLDRLDPGGLGSALSPSAWKDYPKSRGRGPSRQLRGPSAMKCGELAGRERRLGWPVRLELFPGIQRQIPPPTPWGSIPVNGPFPLKIVVIPGRARQPWERRNAESRHLSPFRPASSYSSERFSYRLDFLPAGRPIPALLGVVFGRKSAPERKTAKNSPLESL